MPSASSRAASTRRDAIETVRGSRAGKSAGPGKPVERHRRFRRRNPWPTPGMRLGGSEIAPVGTFPPPLPSRSERPHIRLAFLESHFRSEEHTSELQVTTANLVCRLLLEKNKNIMMKTNSNT